MNLVGYWQSEHQTRVGEHARKVYEEKKNLRRKGQQDCQDACENGGIGGLAANGFRSILEGRQHPVKKSNEEWKFWS